MIRPRPALAALIGALALTACGVPPTGVPPTGVLDGGDPAGGLTKGLRLYFVSHSGRLEAVSRPGIRVPDAENLINIVKYLADLTDAERASGLTSLVEDAGVQEVTAGDGTVTVDIAERYWDPSSRRDRNMTGQLVCSMARARALADPTGATRTDDIRVTVRPENQPGREHVCSDFLGTQ
ncbi:hypothetical protein AB0D49_28170 [Streptomyces sp. NPDC048290]|uniref:hypothetical protein n=1 Tax=Streptomyces sp. NPDC048290 TaxID=3155811 RepID=UPI0034403463